MIRLHNQNRTHTFIDVESGQFISLPKDETDKPPVNADINGLQFFGKSTQDGEPTAENPVDPVDIPPEFNLTVCGKNILPDKEENWEQGTLASADGMHVSAPNRIRLKSEYMIRIIPNTQITGSFISGYVLLAVHEYNISKQWIGRQAELSTVTVSENTHFVRLVVARADSGDLVPSDIGMINAQLELGNMSTPYQPYQGSTYPYRLEDLDGNLHELCSLPDGTRDEYDRDNGVLIKRVKRLVITSGTEPYVWRYHSATEISSIILMADIDNLFSQHTDNANSYSSHFRAVLGENTVGYYGIGSTGYSGKKASTIYLRVPKEVNTNALAQGYIDKIIADTGQPIIFEYLLAEPQIIPIKKYDPISFPYNQKPKSIQYHTNIFTDVGVEMSGEVRKLGNRKMSEFYWVTENGDKIITEDEDYIMFEY